MKKYIALILACLMALAGVALAEGEWAREGIFIDMVGNMLTVMQVPDESGNTVWYVGAILGEGAYGAPVEPEGNVIRGALEDMDGATITVAVYEEGEDGVALEIEGGETYHFTAMDMSGFEIVDANDSPFGYQGTETVEEQVLYDEDGLKIEATGLETVLYYTVLLLRVTNTSGRDLTLDLMGTSLNGWAWDASLCNVTGEDGEPCYEEGIDLTVPNGETVECGLGYSNEYYFEPCRINAFAQLGFTMRAFEEEDWEGTQFFTPFMTVDTSAAADYVEEYVEEGTLVYDRDGLRVLVVGVEKNDWSDDEYIAVYVDNRSDKDVLIQAPRCEINGKEEEAWFGMEVYAGQRKLDSIGFEETITGIEKLGVTFEAREYIPFADEMPVIGESEHTEIEF